MKSNVKEKLSKFETDTIEEKKKKVLHSETIEDQKTMKHENKNDEKSEEKNEYDEKNENKKKRR